LTHIGVTYKLRELGANGEGICMGELMLLALTAGALSLGVLDTG